MIILSCPNCDSKFKVKEEAIGEQGRLVKCAKCQHKWHATKENATSPNEQATSPNEQNENVTENAASAPVSTPAMEETPPVDIDKAKNILESIANNALDQADELSAKIIPDDSGRSSMQDDMVNDFNAMPAPVDPPPIPPKLTRRQPVVIKEKSTGKSWLFLFFLMIATAVAIFFFRKDIVNIYPPAHKVFEQIGLSVDTLGHGLELPKATASRTVNDGKVIWAISGNVANVTDQILALPLLEGVLKDAKGTILISWVFKADEKMVLPGDAVSYHTKIENPPRGGIDLSITFISKTEADSRNSNIDAKNEEETSN